MHILLLRGLFAQNYIALNNVRVFHIRTIIVQAGRVVFLLSEVTVAVVVCCGSGWNGETAHTFLNIFQNVSNEYMSQTEVQW